jgi:hypothetical protein
MERRLVQKVFEEAVNRGSAEVIQLLLKNDVEFDINARFAKESLLTAAERGRETMIPLLLDVGANIQGKDDRGDSTPLGSHEWPLQNCGTTFG